MEGSILESLGGEILAILSPVSICMLLVVLLVHNLSPHGSDASVTSIALLVYDEKSTDSFSEKLGGAVLNAIVFVIIVAVVTFVLVLLFYYRYTRFLKLYMGFSAFMVLAYMGGAVATFLIQAWSIPVDVITFVIVIGNFATVGVLAIFFCKMPIVFTQGYLVIIGALVAYWFSMLPEWTTWVLLMAMALYDLVAVLVPGGPLNILVELAVSRDEEIPALIYEARPALQNSAPASNSLTHRQRWRRRTAASAPGNNSGSVSIDHRPPAREEAGPLEVQIGTLGQIGFMDSGNGNARLHSETDALPEWSPTHITTQASLGTASSSHSPDEDSVPLVSHSQTSANLDGMEDSSREGQGWISVDTFLDEVVGAEGEGGVLSGAIKLGLGDFIFYSVLVGRAAMYDLMTVYACYLAVIAGLGSTLVLLAIWKRALPALPISISMGLLFYLLTRLLLDPFVVDLSTHLVFF